MVRASILPGRWTSLIRTFWFREKVKGDDGCDLKASSIAS